MPLFFIKRFFDNQPQMYYFHSYHPYFLTESYPQDWSVWINQPIPTTDIPSEYPLTALSGVKLEIIFDYLPNNVITHCVTNRLPQLLEIIFFRPKDSKKKRIPKVLL